MCVRAKLFQSCPGLSATLCPPPGGLPNPGIKPVTQVFCIAGRFFTTSATWEAPQKYALRLQIRVTAVKVWKKKKCWLLWKFPQGILSLQHFSFISFNFLLGYFPRISVSRFIALQPNVATSSKALFSTRECIRSQGELIQYIHPCHSPVLRVHQTFSEGVPGTCT